MLDSPIVSKIWKAECNPVKYGIVADYITAKCTFNIKPEQVEDI